MKYLFVVLTVLAGAVSTISCRDRMDPVEVRDAQDVIISKKPIWQLPNTADPNKADGAITYSLLINGNVLDNYSYKPGTGKPTMVLRDPQTGSIKWEWNEVLRDFEPINIYRGSTGLFENYLFYKYGSRNYCIDARTGQTVWRKQTGYSAFSNSAMLGSTYFTKGTPQALQDQSIVEDRVLMGDVQTGNEVELIMPPYSRKSIRTAASWKQWVGLISDVYPIQQGGETLLIIVYNETAPEINKYEAYIGLYNITQKKWVYDRRRLNDQWPESANTSWLTVSGDKMFTILNNAVACSNWRTGELIWFRPLPSFAQIPTPIEDKYLAVFSTDSRLFLLDIKTGGTIWEKNREIMSTTNQMYYDQGILYYLTANLNAIEIPSGKKLWSIPSPTDGKTDGNFWGFIVGTPGQNGQKGRIFTRTGYHTYCYEAIK
jgi:outer membrane protein assembly factor BamB